MISLKDIGKQLNESSFDILIMLSKKEEMKYKEIRQELGVSQEKARVELGRLEGGLLVKLVNPRDNRQKLFAITEHGLEILEMREKGEI
jgi:DNA-binding MarR family transcriptional regulator